MVDSSDKNLSAEILDRVRGVIQQNWNESNAWPEFVKAMQWTLNYRKTEDGYRTGKSPAHLAILPGLCCQAAGGDSQWADQLSAAWLLFFVSAHLMDAVQDEDLNDPFLVKLDPSVILNVASGYYFSASKILNQYHDHSIIGDRVVEIIAEIYDQFLIMCSGQYQDLIRTKPSLRQYWEIAQSKSGVFFSMACRFGANLATSDRDLLEGYSKYGHHLGLLVQIYDDLEEIDHIKEDGKRGNNSGIRRSLPVVFAMETLPKKLGDHLENLLKNISKTADEIIKLIDQSGAGFYIEIEIQKHREEAIRALDEVKPLSPMGAILLSLLPDIP